jgi:hypothetical protein
VSKYQNKSEEKVFIWFSRLLDRICWGNKNKSEIFGYISTKSILGLKAGCLGAKNLHSACTILSSEENLEIEFASSELKREWIAAMKLVIKFPSDSKK